MSHSDDDGTTTAALAAKRLYDSDYMPLPGTHRGNGITKFGRQFLLVVDELVIVRVSALTTPNAIKVLLCHSSGK